MKNEAITDYLFEQLSEAERFAFERQMANDAALRQEVNELKAVWGLLKDTELTTDKLLDEGFYKLLEEEKDNVKTPIIALKPAINWSSFMRYAAAVVAIAGAFWAGRQTASAPVEYRTIAAVRPPETTDPVPPKAVAFLEKKAAKKAIAPKENPPTIVKEMAELRKEMQMTQELVVLSLLKEQSASARLRGLNYAAALNQPANVVIEALIKTLREDESVNLRLSAIEALERFKIKSALVEKLTQSTEPIEQLALIESLVRLQAKESLPVLQQLEKNQDTEQLVRLAARNGREELSITE